MSNEKRPNILFVFSDQQRYSALGANGNDIIQTPVLDAMAAEGMVCDNMFSNHPLCSPYRAILLTGRYGWQNLVIDNEYSPRRDIPTLPGTLREHGYGTAHVGTWHLGKGPYGDDNRYGLDYLAALAGGRGRGAYFDRTYYENDEGPNFYGGWAPTNETDLAIQFMEKHLDARTDDPFAVFVSWRPPHWPYMQYPDEYNIYDPADMDVPGNVPDEMKAWAHEELADYYGCCTGLDAEMGRLLEALDRLGVKDNTIVCYTSDHGDHLSSHGYGKPSSRWLDESMRASKATPYEESCHVPFVVRWPDAIEAGTRKDALFGAIDIVHTLLGPCGVP
ncbi:MAG: sulfatase-like hydrolase/transferase, partial [Gemmatimonadota bacterium]|nr:sulfatase-like hydrolase/transferase [Gemmatimonadota bacterium]